MRRRPPRDRSWQQQLRRSGRPPPVHSPAAAPSGGAAPPDRRGHCRRQARRMTAGLLSAIRRTAGQQHFDAMPNGAYNCQQVLFGSFFAARKIDDQGPPADNCGGAGQAASGRDFHTLRPHRFRDASCFPLHHRKGGLRGHIPRRKAGTTGGQHKVNRFYIRTFDQFFFNLFQFIGDNAV